jgi:hypothetical protein
MRFGGSGFFFSTGGGLFFSNCGLSCYLTPIEECLSFFDTIYLLTVSFGAYTGCATFFI